MDLDLDSSLRGISGDMESLDSLFQSETVGDKWFQINEPARDEPNCFRVLYEGVSGHQQGLSQRSLIRYGENY